MKLNFRLLILAVLLLFSCRQKAPVVQVDPELLKGQINELMDKYNAALNARDVTMAVSFYSDDLLFIGTDPSEFLDKKGITDGWTQMAADSSGSIGFSVDKREIRLDKPGTSAIVVDQYTVPSVSQKIPVRCICHLTLKEDGWAIDFVSVAFTPRNEDVGKLNLALE